MTSLEGTWVYRNMESGHILVDKRQPVHSYIYLISENQEHLAVNTAWFNRDEKSITESQYKILRNAYLFMSKIKGKVDSITFTNDNSFIIN